MANFKEDLSLVEAFVFDCDGVFTDGSLTLLPPDYEACRTFNARDGFAVSLAVKRGYPVALISGGRGEAVRRRFESLGVKHVELGCGDKLRSVRAFAEANGVDMKRVLFMGDDVPDAEARGARMPQRCSAGGEVGVAICVASGRRTRMRARRRRAGA